MREKNSVGSVTKPNLTKSSATIVMIRLVRNATESLIIFTKSNIIFGYARIALKKWQKGYFMTEITKTIRVKTIDGRFYKFPLDDVAQYDFEYTPTVLRVDFKDGTFVEFTRRNIIFAGIGIYAYTIRERKEQE
jgi:hypothetical protein